MTVILQFKFYLQRYIAEQTRHAHLKIINDMSCSAWVKLDVEGCTRNICVCKVINQLVKDVRV